MDAGLQVKEGEVHKPAGADANAAAEPPRLRQYFPETMLWLPEVITDETGRLNLEIPVADSITTWRITACWHLPRMDGWEVLRRPAGS